MRILVAFFSLLALGVMAYLLWPEPAVRFPPGVTAPDEPIQSTAADKAPWVQGEYRITPLTTFHIRARVLHRKSYRSGRESDLSPMDLALGWGRMSDQAVIDQLDFSQHSRWYFWNASRLPLPSREIETHSSNMHMIPGDEETASLLDDVERGDLVEIEGFLVQIRGNDGWKWKSSTSRTDTGNGACEVVWVENLKILRDESLL